MDDKSLKKLTASLEAVLELAPSCCGELPQKELDDLMVMMAEVRKALSLRVSALANDYRGVFGSPESATAAAKEAARVAHREGLARIREERIKLTESLNSDDGKAALALLRQMKRDNVLTRNIGARNRQARKAAAIEGMTPSDNGQ